MRRRWTMIAWVPLLLCVSCGVEFEQTEEEIDLGYRGPARYNRLLAAERFCREMGYQTQSHPGFYKLPPHDHALVVPAAALDPRERLTKQLPQWVRDGGHLVCVSHNIYRFETFTDFLEEQEDESKAKVEPEDQDDTWKKFLNRFGILTLEDEGGATDQFQTEDGDQLIMRLDSGPRFRSKDQPPSIWVGPEDEAGLLSVPVGAGRITILADATPLTNEEIGKADHARALWVLLGQDANRFGVWFVYDSRSSFMAMLWNRFWPLLIALAVAVIIWLWRSAGRFGPLQASHGTSNRQFVEHIRATGRFLWRRRCGATLVGAPRHRVFRRIRQLYPEADHIEPTRLDALIGARCGLATERVGRALRTDVGTDGSLMLKIFQDLQRMEQKL